MPWISYLFSGITHLRTIPGSLALKVCKLILLVIWILGFNNFLWQHNLNVIGIIYGSCHGCLDVSFFLYSWIDKVWIVSEALAQDVFIRTLRNWHTVTLFETALPDGPILVHNYTWSLWEGCFLYVSVQLMRLFASLITFCASERLLASVRKLVIL